MTLYIIEIAKCQKDVNKSSLNGLLPLSKQLILKVQTEKDTHSSEIVKFCLVFLQIFETVSTFLIIIFQFKDMAS